MNLTYFISFTCKVKLKLRIVVGGIMKKILIIEDDDHIIELLKFNVENNGYEVDVAMDGREGLNKAVNDLPDLILLDLMLPSIDGIDICKKLKNKDRTKDIPIIMLTAKGHETDKILGLEIGADDYITKPFTPELLIAKIDNLLKSRNLLKRYYSQKVTLASTDIEIEPHQEQFIRQAMEIVERNLTNAQFNATLLAEALNMSQPTLYRRIKAFTGDNMATFIRSIRIKQAAQLLRSGHYSVGETATKVGFSDTAYFRKCFTQQFGVTPSKYKGEG